MTFFRKFLICAFCALVIKPSYAAYTALEQAIIKSDVSRAKAIVDKDKSVVNSMTTDSSSGNKTMLAHTISWCCGAKENGRYEIAKLLIDNGADINAETELFTRVLGSHPKGTMLDLVRSRIQYDDSCKQIGNKVCKDIEQYLIEKGAEAYKESSGVNNQQQTTQQKESDAQLQHVDYISSDMNAMNLPEIIAPSNDMQEAQKQTKENLEKSIQELEIEEESNENGVGTGNGQQDSGTKTDKNSGNETAGESKTDETSSKVDDAKKAYDDAKATEQSTANKMLGGATMAATGIGGMQLAQGLAEKSADESADKDMQAYLATFKCKVSDKSYTGGTMDIDVGGTNSLITLYQEYVDLAADLKTRKEALGQKPGIESEVILNKAEMGLYDDTPGKGIENGTYASLYRASRGNENDKNKLAEQKESSANRVKGGAIAAGGGALGGAIGNFLINDDDDDEDEKVTKEDCTKAGGTFKDDKCTCKDKDKKYKKGKCVDKSSSLSSVTSSLGSKVGGFLGGGSGDGISSILGVFGNNVDISSLNLDSDMVDTLKSEYGDELKNMDTNQILQAVKTLKK